MTTVARTRKAKPSSKAQRRRTTKPQSVSIPTEELVLSNRLQAAFITFLEHHPLKRFSPNLRSMTLQFIMSGGSEATYLKDLLLDLDGLFDLLTIAEAEIR